MPLCGATFDENSVPPWTRGDFRGVLGQGTNPPRRCAPPLHRSGFSRESILTSRAFTASSQCLSLILALLTFLPCLLLAQFDMVIFEKRSPQARSREELNAVLDIVQTSDPKNIVTLCSEFRKEFPTSEFSGHVYRMEMHAFEVLNDYQKVIEVGGKALEVNPHDVDALLTLASTIPNGINDLSAESAVMLDKAERYARQALDEISELKATRGVTLEKWRKLTGRMRSSAQEALGFIAFKRGHYADSVAALEKAIRFDPEAGGAVFFRLGVAYLYNGKPLEAQVVLERSCQLGPEFIRTKAKEQLAIIGKDKGTPK
jgi:tetratricopeptide (TPR) repeat protein